MISFGIPKDVKVTILKYCCSSLAIIHAVRKVGCSGSETGTDVLLS
jgi:hypothetical protein